LVTKCKEISYKIIELIDVQIEEELVIRLIFEQGYSLEIPLLAPNGLDAAHFLPYYDGPLQVWD
jgi:hypothetical protein